MSIFEYDKEEEEKKLRKAEYEAGREEGKEEGIIIGERTGIVNTLQSMIFSFLTDYGAISEELKSFILNEQNEEKLRQWSKLAARVSSVEEFWKKIA